MHTLRAVPLRHSGRPQYPTKLAVRADPELLRRHVPAAWLSRRELAGALGIALAGGATGCGSNMPAPPTSGPAHVAPVFMHGKGLTDSPALGPLVFAGMGPPPADPAYLPEDEALRIIANGLRSVGLHATARDVRLQSVVIAGRICHNDLDWLSGQRRQSLDSTIGPLEVDLVDPQRQVYIEYVTPADYYVLGAPDRFDIDLTTAAALAGTAVAEHARGIWFGTFYDPVETYDWADLQRVMPPMSPAAGETDAQFIARYRKAEDAARVILEAQARSGRSELRLQVKDFIDWLKAQGAI